MFKIAILLRFIDMIDDDGDDGELFLWYGWPTKDV